jgi:methylation protein EvaC
VGEDIYQGEWVRSHADRLGAGAGPGHRSACGGCGGGRLWQFLDLGKTPLADRFPATADEPEEWYPLGAAVCEDCWLTQVTEVVPDGELFGAGYGFRTGSSPSAAEYFARWADWALGLFGERARQLTVEIACNDGTLLRHFAAAGCPVAGVEPSGAARDAAAAGLPVLAEPFGWDVAGRIRDEHGPAGLVIACNVVAHVSDLFAFLSGIRRLTAPDGVAVIEFQYLPRLIAGGQIDHVYHEHRFFFTLDALARACEQAWGLTILAAEQVAAQGGSLRVIIGSGQPSPGVADLRESEKWLRDRSAYAGLQARAQFTRSELLSVLGGLRRQGTTVAGYGASAKSCTLLNFCDIGPGLVSHVEDVTPGKAGRVTPGTHIPITAPGDREPPGAYLLLAWNYLSGIIRRERAYLDGGGRLIVPVPVPVIL